MNTKLLDIVEDTSKKNAKVTLLAQADDQMRRFITMALSQDITFGVTDDGEYEQFEPDTKWSATKFWDSFEALLNKLAVRELTGNAANSAVQNIFENAPSRLDLKWATRILNRNLRAGFDMKTCNKAWGKNTIEKFRVQLADTYEDQVLEGEWLFEPKLNGNRCVGIDKKFMSRGNREYTSAPAILEQLRDINGFFEDFAIDGEMMGDLGFDESSGALRRKSEKGRKKANFTYWVFDLFKRDEYDTDKQTQTLRERKKMLRWLFDAKGKNFVNIQMVPGQVVKNPTHKQIMEITKEYVKNGFEGAMAKRLDSVAKFDRGPDLLKIKLFFEDEFKIVDFYEGNGKLKGSLGGIIVEGKINWGLPGKPRKEYNIRSKCGSGFDEDLRQEIWDNRKKWLGAVVQIQFQEATKKNSLQFPVFIMRRKDKE